MEKENFLKQLEKQERDFLGNEDESKSTFKLIHWSYILIVLSILSMKLPFRLYLLVNMANMFATF